MQRDCLQAARILILAAGLAIVGCSGGPKFEEVTGTVKAGNKPLENIQVEFWPEVSGPRSLGVTGKDGHFTLHTDDGKRAGAVVGPHKVVLVDLATYEGVPLNMSRQVEKMDMKSTRIRDQYATPAGTPFKREVVANRANDIAIDVNAP
jgi:hypothetical protein